MYTFKEWLHEHTDTFPELAETLKTNIKGWKRLKGVPACDLTAPSICETLGCPEHVDLMEIAVVEGRELPPLTYHQLPLFDV